MLAIPNKSTHSCVHTVFRILQIQSNVQLYKSAQIHKPISKEELILVEFTQIENELSSCEQHAHPPRRKEAESIMILIRIPPLSKLSHIFVTNM